MALVKAKPPVGDPPAWPAAPADPQAALARLAEELPAARRQAVRELAAEPSAAVIHCLCRHLAVERDEGVQEVIFTTLMGCRRAETVAGLLPYLGSDSAPLRNGAVDVLRTMPEPVAPAIPALLAQEEARVRVMTVSLLVGLAEPRVPGWLRQIIEHDPDVNVCAAAVDALAEVGDASALPALRALVDRFPAVPYLAFAVALALRRLDPGHAGAPLAGKGA